MFFLKILDDQDQELELLARRLPLADPGAATSGGPGRRTPKVITGEELVAFINTDLFPALKNLPISATPGDRTPRRAGASSRTPTTT